MNPRQEEVLKIVQSTTDVHEKGAKISSRFHMVSESQFPNGISPALAAHKVEVPELLERYACGGMDLTGQMLFHRQVDLALLPKWTHEVSFFQKSSTAKKHKGAALGAALEDAAAPAPASAETRSRGDSGLPVLPAIPGAVCA